MKEFIKLYLQIGNFNGAPKYILENTLYNLFIIVTYTLINFLKIITNVTFFKFLPFNNNYIN